MTITAVSVILWWHQLTATTEEQVVSIGGLGVQMRSKTLLGLRQGAFVSLEDIKSVVINEGFERYISLPALTLGRACR